MAEKLNKAALEDAVFETKKNELGFFRTYIVVNPDTSKTYDLWKFVMTTAVIVEIVLVPYAICTNIKNKLYVDPGFGVWEKRPEYYLEFAIDVIFTLNIFYTFATCIKDSKGWNNSASVIAKDYIT
jgi:hypothetical protein